MNQPNSNLKRYFKCYKLILTALFIFTALLLIKPITAYADESRNVTSLNGEAEHGYGSKVGKKHWAGDTDRTGFLFYFVDEDGNLLTTDDLNLSSRVEMPVVIKVCDKNFKDEINKWTQTEYHLKFSYYLNGKTTNEVITVADIWYTDVPTAVQYDSTTGRWSGNGQDVADWLFKECENDIQMWEKVLSIGLMEYTNAPQEVALAIRDLKKYETFNIVIEPIAANAVYGTKTWGSEVDTIRLDDKDDDFYDYLHPDNTKPAINEQGRITRVLSTASYMSKFVYETTLANDDPCPNGGANWKWTNEALPFCMTLQETALGKEAITGGPYRLDYETINADSLSYGMGALTKEIKLAYIHTYDIDTNPKDPAPSEKPDKDKGTDGDCTIYKIYYDLEADYITGEVASTYIDTFTTTGATGRIELVNEKSNSGYKVAAWATTIRPYEGIDSFYKDGGYAGIIQALSTPVYNSTKYTRTQFDIGNPDNGAEGERYHLYIVYTKTKAKEQGEIADYDFEIPESYIIKQVFFSQANNTNHTGNNGNSALKFTDTSLEWVSDKFKCKGHEILGCDKTYHPVHVMDSDDVVKYGYDCRTPVIRYDCDGDGKNYTNSKCGNEHTHGSECLELVNYRCKNCNAIATKSGGTWGITHDSKCDNKKTTSFTSAPSWAVPVYAYKDADYTYKCSDTDCTWSCTPNLEDTLKNGNVVEITDAIDGNKDNPNSGQAVYDGLNDELILLLAIDHYNHDKNCGGTISLSTIKCKTEEHKCDDWTIPLLEWTGECSLGLEEHNCLTEGCLSEKIYCKPYLTDKKAVLKVKNTKQDDFPSILIKSTLSDSLIINAGTAFDATDTLRSMQSSINIISEKYGWVEHTRTTTKADNTKEGNIKYDFSTLLVRGKDKIVLADWLKNSTNPDLKEDQTNAINFIPVLTNQFTVGNTPSNTGEKKTYTDTFSAEFDNASSESELETKAKFKKNSDVKDGAIEVDRDAVNDGLLGFLKIFKTYKKCPDTQTQSYELETTYNIPTIKVLVNLFSDYEETSASNGDAQITFYPYIRMYYDTLSCKNLKAYVVGKEQRTFKVHDGAEIKYINGTGILDLTSAQWSTHASAAQSLASVLGITDKKDTRLDRILPGGAALDLSISKENIRTVQAITYHVLLEGDGLAQVEATGSHNTQTIAQAYTYHNKFADAVAEAHENLYIKQYVSSNVSSSTKPDTLVESGGSYNGNKLSSDDKYYFNNYTLSKLQTEELGTRELARYTVRTTVAGKIQVLNSSGEIIASESTLADILKDDIVAEIDEETGVVTGLYNAVLSNSGNDTTLSNPKWYNEAFDGVTVLLLATDIQIGLFKQNPISTITDPRLIPPQSTSQQDGGGSIFTAFYASQYKAVKADGSKTISVSVEGYKGGKLEDSQTLANLYQSQIFYIPNVTVQDLN